MNTLIEMSVNFGLELYIYPVMLEGALLTERSIAS
jgi:hypothetical protein